MLGPFGFHIFMRTVPILLYTIVITSLIHCFLIECQTRHTKQAALTALLLIGQRNQGLVLPILHVNCVQHFRTWLLTPLVRQCTRMLLGANNLEVVGHHFEVRTS